MGLIDLEKKNAIFMMILRKNMWLEYTRLEQMMPRC